MKTDSWAKCKTVNGPDPKKQSSWCAALHDNRGNLWCGVLFGKLQCPWRDEDGKTKARSDKRE